MPARHWLYVSGFVGSGVGVVGAGLLALLESLSVLFGPPTDAFVLSAMLEAAAEWIVLSFILALLAVLFFVAAVVSLIRTLSVPRNERVASLFSWLERTHPALEAVGISNKFEPTAEDRKQQLKERYVDGEISEREFERRMDQLMDETVPENTSPRAGKALELGEESR